LIGEYPPTVQDGIEVLWLDNTPIAVLKRRPGSSNGTATGGGTATAWNGRAAGGVEVFFIHPDHLDTPRLIVNQANQPVWRWDSAPFGDTAANERPTAGIAADFAFNLRFPGQQYDRETGTHYNYFRDYEPKSGTYTKSDPVGPILGGLNTYQYAWGDPVGFADVLGLAPTIRQRCGCTIYGTLQDTRSQGHWFRTGRWVIEEIRCGAIEIFLDRAWTTITGDTSASRRRPDGAARFPSGCVNACETPSRSDDPTELLRRLMDGRRGSGMPPGTNVVLEKCCKKK
jgi:RHS repeat-associated protein